MAITTSAGNGVKFLGLSQTIRDSLLKAILGNSANGTITVNTAKICYVGLSSTDPETKITEPSDANYKRIVLGETPAGSGATWKSEYLTVSNATAINSGVKNEIKFNRSLEAWSGSYPYFFLASSASGSTGLLAWGELTEPITVSAKNVVPLFEENKFRLYFPTPATAESVVDAAADADQG